VRNVSWTKTPVLVMGLIPCLAAAGCGRPALDLPPVPRQEITGTILRDGAPVANASVHLEGTPLGVVANGRGQFRIPSVAAGDYMLSVVYLGYRSRQVPVTVPGGSAENVDLDLVPDSRLGPPLAGVDPKLTLTYRAGGGS
jgi:hypothetical protein